MPVGPAETGTRQSTSTGQSRQPRTHGEHGPSGSESGRRAGVEVAPGRTRNVAICCVRHMATKDNPATRRCWPLASLRTGAGDFCVLERAGADTCAGRVIGSDERHWTAGSARTPGPPGKQKTVVG